MSTSTTNRKPVKAKPPRYIRWTIRPTPAKPVGMIEVTEGEKADHYTVQRIAADYGLAFIVKKMVPDARSLDEALSNEPYHVNLDRQTGRHSCECKGWERWQRCRHVAGLLVLPGISEMPLS
jgi:hypothetical protein